MVLIQLVQNVTLALFLMEMLLKYIVMPETFFKSSLNIVDLTMILASFILTNTEIMSGVGQIVSILRSIRCKTPFFKSFFWKFCSVISSLKKLRNRWPSLWIVYETLKLTLGEIAMLLLLFFFLAIIFVSGSEFSLFKGSSRGERIFRSGQIFWLLDLKTWRSTRFRDKKQHLQPNAKMFS